MIFNDRFFVSPLSGRALAAGSFAWWFPVVSFGGWHPRLTPCGSVRRVSELLVLGCLLVLVCGCQQQAVSVEKAEFKKTKSLFDGETLDGWELTVFGGEGDISVEDGCIVMDAGDPLTAINFSESFELPTTNYEIQYDAMKVDGTDFFGSITFPVGKSSCSMVIGGWAGTVVGLSSIDGVDASENETRVVRKFERNQWYRLRVRVTPQAIQGWIDDEQVINQSIVGKELDIRSEMIPCQPLGIANFYTIAKIKNIELRWLADSP